MSRHLTATTSVAAATKFILAASQKVWQWNGQTTTTLLLLGRFCYWNRTVTRRGQLKEEKWWQKVADNLNSHAILRFLVTKKSVREHLKLLLDKYRARMQKERRDSGVEVEETELDRALEEINEKWEAAEEQDILLLNNKKKTEEDRAMGEEVRKRACEKLSETMKRKGEGEGSSEPSKKRSRKGGNDTIEFLREKANIDMAMKQEEQKARREEHERQTRLYELALANQQQQQQQSNQLMSLMFGLMQQIAGRKDS
ncbi:hypothetical protein AWC38_SpisGene18775 [Stylophora pistillata]|uniref:Uncharacterized protein n=1 Tax=Stylophora pistillata TaxID=50429 RepID=A0A2B4REX7_STYPI|nr:hypothetical protein AWC38_SpisGene18775 [Stylophora pistillata]